MADLVIKNQNELDVLKKALDVQLSILVDTATEGLWVSPDGGRTGVSIDELVDIKTDIDDNIDRILATAQLRERLEYITI